MCHNYFSGTWLSAYFIVISEKLKQPCMSKYYVIGFPWKGRVFSRFNKLATSEILLKATYVHSYFMYEYDYFIKRFRIFFEFYHILISTHGRSSTCKPSLSLSGAKLRKENSTLKKFWTKNDGRITRIRFKWSSPHLHIGSVSFLFSVSILKWKLVCWVLIEISEKENEYRLFPAQNLFTETVLVRSFEFRVARLRVFNFRLKVLWIFKLYGFSLCWNAPF